jgi:hypothetical protein
MKSFLPNRLYDILSWVALIAMDAIGLFYKTIATVWHLPYGNEILATCTAISLLIGTLIGVSKIDYRNQTNAEIKKIGEEVAEEMKNENL